MIHPQSPVVLGSSNRTFCTRDYVLVADWSLELDACKKVRISLLINEIVVCLWKSLRVNRKVLQVVGGCQVDYASIIPQKSKIRIRSPGFTSEINGNSPSPDSLPRLACWNLILLSHPKFQGHVSRFTLPPSTGACQLQTIRRPLHSCMMLAVKSGSYSWWTAHLRTQAVRDDVHQPTQGEPHEPVIVWCSDYFATMVLLHNIQVKHKLTHDCIEGAELWLPNQLHETAESRGYFTSKLMTSHWLLRPAHATRPVGEWRLF